MQSLGVLVASVGVWIGTAQVDVLIRQPGGEHPYTTDFVLQYSEGARIPVTGSGGRRVGDQVQLIPRRIAIDVRHEVRHADGRSICKGGGEELVANGPLGALRLPADGNPGDIGWYQLVLPRAIGAFACGDKVNAGDRWVVVGTGLFQATGDVRAADGESRRLESDGSRMRGEFRFSDSDRGGQVRHDYRVRWNLERLLEP
jgi:hypothetical protein